MRPAIMAILSFLFLVAVIAFLPAPQYADVRCSPASVEAMFTNCRR